MSEGRIASFTHKLGVMILEEYKFLQGVEEQVVFLRDEFEWISSFLCDAAVQRNRYERVDVWVSQIRDLAYDAEDVLDIFIYRVKRLQERNIRGLINYPVWVITLHKLGYQIDNINKRIEKISTYRSKYAIDKLEEKEYFGKDVVFNKRRALDAEEDDVVGFKSQSEDVAEMLLIHEEDSSKLHVVSIVGMLGAGKSTLAHMVYNNVKNQFDSCAWVDVSQEFKPKTLLESIEKQNSGKREFGKLLVVFDDARRIKDWDTLYHNVLGKIKSTESRVLLISHSHEVATHANPHMKPYEIKLLSKGDSLGLLKMKVFHEENFPNNELKEVAEKIVDKCRGLPLAIVVLSGLLSRKQKTVDIWTKLLESANWQQLQGSTECFEIVALSYDNLPNFLKPCFLYFGLFPEDWLVDCEDLIQLWIAEGFIQERGDEIMEDVAEDYLEELIRRNMIQVGRRRFNGNLETCRIHELLREFAISKGRQDKFLDILGNNKGKAIHTMSRRLVVHPTKEEYEESSIPKSSSLNNPRSMLFFSLLKNIRSIQDKHFYKSFKLLRVLDLRGASSYLKSLPDEIGKLILLKYLNLRRTGIKRLPSSIRNLRNLQTLDISGTGIDGIPRSVWELEELRHFYADLHHCRDSNSPDDNVGNGFSCNVLPLMMMLVMNFLTGAPPLQIGRLKNLWTLSASGGNWISEDDFSQLINLRKLRLQLFEVNMDDRYGIALSHSIPKFIYLRELDIHWIEGKLQIFPDSLSQHVHLYKIRLVGEMEKLPTHPDAFPPNLIELELYRTALKQEEGDFSIKTLAALKNLKFLYLGVRFLLGKKMVFPAKGFPNLIRLHLRYLTDIEEWKVEEGSLPNLKVLNLEHLRSLRELPDGLGQVTTLQELELYGLPQKIQVSVKRKEGDDWNKIKHIPIIRCR